MNQAAPLVEPPFRFAEATALIEMGSAKLGTWQCVATPVRTTVLVPPRLVSQGRRLSCPQACDRSARLATASRAAYD